MVEANPNWDFCLIQHNYLDYEYEAGVLGPKYAAANGMGLAVMKPARTGFLANLPDVMRKALASTGVHKPDNEWALDYLWDIPEVSVAVSGMGSMKDVEENLKYAAKAKPNMLTPAEREALGNAIRAYREAPGHVDCTGCYKCIPCPNNVAIGYILPMFTIIICCTKIWTKHFLTTPFPCRPFSAAHRQAPATAAASALPNARRGLTCRSSLKKWPKPSAFNR